MGQWLAYSAEVLLLEFVRRLESTAGELWLKTMKTHSSNRFTRSPAFWVMVGVLILLNVWFDYYHPIGIIFDVIIGVIWFFKSSSRSTDDV